MEITSKDNFNQNLISRFSQPLFNLRENGLDLHVDTRPHNQSWGHYSTHLFAKKADKVIKEHDKSKPLFLYTALQAVHGPLEVS